MTDLSELAAAVGALLKERAATVAVNESSTGGIISAASHSSTCGLISFSTNVRTIVRKA